MGESASFSRQVKDELCAVASEHSVDEKFQLLACLFASARLRPGLIQLTTAHRGFAELAANWFGLVYNVDAELQQGRELTSITVENKRLYRQISDDLRKKFNYDSALNNLSEISLPGHQWQQYAIRCMLLAAGSIGDPKQAYHLEFALRRQPAAAWLQAQLLSLDIPSHFLKRNGYNVVYLKEGQLISELLLQCGAHSALLEFESLRVEKDMRNSVNRVVNCDSANSQRIANASARQLELLRQLEERHGLGVLPDELRSAAQARLENPDFSLKELGEIMQPPLGKSGMNHRLKKLERIAAELIEE